MGNLGLALTSSKFRLLELRIGHLIFKAMSLKALAMFKLRAMLIPVVIVLYSFFWFSVWTPLFSHTFVATI
jgi:hypothetical protein